MTIDDVAYGNIRVPYLPTLRVAYSRATCCSPSISPTSDLPEVGASTPASPFAILDALLGLLTSPKLHSLIERSPLVAVANQLPPSLAAFLRLHVPVHLVSCPTILHSSSTEYGSCPFNKEDYKRVRVHLVKHIQMMAAPQGTLLLVEDKYDTSEDDPDSRGLLVHIGGDTLTGISYAASEREPERPMTLNLLLNMLEHLRSQQPLDWHLLHVAIVDIRDDIYIGRLFFGNPETGEIRWDCDCRPSDACWMSLKVLCPIYIRNYVWEQCALSLDKLFSSTLDVRSELEKLQSMSESAARMTTETSDPLTTIRSSQQQP